MKWSVPSLLLVTGFLFAADKAEDVNKKALEALQGEWNVKSAVREGEERPAAELEKVKLKVAGDTFTIAEDGKDRPAKVKIDATRKPSEIDLTHDSDTMKGIYKLEGDTFTICLSRPGVDRPKEFKSDAGSKTFLVVFKKK
jgi:uncharacterized protein (TIGR03067 family)